MLHLPCDVAVARRASPDAEADQQVAEITERRERGPRLAEAHRRASDRVHHPSGHRQHDAGRRDEAQDHPGRPSLGRLDPQRPTAQGVPWVVDDDVLPDMGRMTGRW
ncbi:MAG: hypothetical protein ACK5WM_21655, partial [Rhodospirillales bacterium]